MLFSDAEIENIDQIWRSLDPEHPWTGWAVLPDSPQEIWIFRTRANWRRFILRKEEGAYILSDEVKTSEASFDELSKLALKVNEVPALPN